MSDCMYFPDTVEEFMEQYKMTDTKQVYSNGIEYVPIFRMKQWFEHEAAKGLPDARPERLTDDDFETIRIHLNAHKEALCNQHRWKEAEEYQRIIDRFMAFASTIEQDWTPCKKPPTKNDAYLVTVHPDYIVPGGGQVDILVWVDDDWFYMVYDTEIARYRTTRFPDPVIAWRPLPAPYKEAPHD